MPDFLVELSFEYRTTYRVTTDTAAQAITAAEHHEMGNIDDAINLAVLRPMEFADYLDTRVFNAAGEEIEAAD